MLNHFQIQGRFISDPELKATPSGVSVCRFTLACSRNYKNSEGNYDADFFNLVAWRNNAERVSKRHKGDTALAVGHIQNTNYEKDGVKHYRTEFIVDEIHFLTKASSSTSAPTSESDQVPQYDDIEFNDPDLPF